MPLDTRFLHWQQAADDELLSQAGELLVDAGDVSFRNAAGWEAQREVWEARARAVSAENAAMREDDA